MVMNLKIKKSAVIARMFDMHRVNECKSMGVEAMDVIIYLPEDRAYAAMPRRRPATMKRRVVSYREGDGRTAAIIFTGVQINLEDKKLRRLCGRLILAKKSLVAYVRRLAQS